MQVPDLFTPEDEIADYTFGKRSIRHRFCPVCGIHLFAESADSSGSLTMVINVRCLEDVELSSLPVLCFDGRSL